MPVKTPWYALWVISNAEFVVEDALRGLVEETFLPTWSEVTQWSDRKKTIVRPLFPGYLFLRSEGTPAPEILQIAGVIKFLPDNFNPKPVDAAELENLRRAIASGRPLKVCDYVAGDEVVIDSGPLAGVRGIVKKTKDGARVVVRIEMLHRAVSVELDAEELKKAA